MTASPQLRGLAYALTSAAALAATASQLGTYLPLGLIEGNIRFWGDTLANPASRFITADIFFVFLVVWHWMLGEARRLGMRGPTIVAYFLGSLLIAFSAALPLFMWHRERLMVARGEAPARIGGPAAQVSVWLVLLACLAYSWRAWPGH
jgi:hypothetical protein